MARLPNRYGSGKTCYDRFIRARTELGRGIATCFEKSAVNSLLAFVIVSLQIWLPKKITRHARWGRVW
ncbi:transposase [Desmospora sp. 8437]|nr:transposase [Desmospora sp. 8437]